jgi:hypothetical protein
LISLGPGNRTIRLSVDAFIEGKAGELARRQKILSFRDYISKHHTATTSREEDAILGAVDDLVGRYAAFLPRPLDERLSFPTRRVARATTPTDRNDPSRQRRVVILRE